MPTSSSSYNEDSESLPVLTLPLLVVGLCLFIVMAVNIASDLWDYFFPLTHGHLPIEQQFLRNTLQQDSGLDLHHDIDRLSMSSHCSYERVGGDSIDLACLKWTSSTMSIEVFDDSTSWDLRPWVRAQTPTPLKDLWLQASVPADQVALAYTIAHAGWLAVPDNYTVDSSQQKHHQRTTTLASAQQAMSGSAVMPTIIPAFRAIKPSDDGLSATALFDDGLMLPLKRASVTKPWKIITQGPGDFFGAVLKADRVAS